MVRDAGTTVVITTHYMDEAEQLCDRVAQRDLRLPESSQSAYQAAIKPSRGQRIVVTIALRWEAECESR